MAAPNKTNTLPEGIRRRAGRDGYQVDVQRGGQRLRRQAATLEDALRLRAQLTAQLEQGGGAPPTLDALLDLYLDELRAGPQRASTVERARSSVRALQRSELGTCTALDLATSQVVAYLRERRAAGLSAHALQRDVFYLKATLRQAHVEAVRVDWVTVKRDGVGQVPRPQPRALTAEQLRQVLDAATQQPFGGLRALVRVLLATGLRNGEARRLVWADVDLAGERVHVRGQTKTGAERVASLSPGAVQELLDLKAAQGEHAAPDAPVFQFKPGRAWVQVTLIRRVRRLLESVGVNGVKPTHVFRATMATRALEAGVSVPEVQAQGGWASSRVLLDSYAAASETGRRKAAAAADV